MTNLKYFTIKEKVNMDGEKFFGAFLNEDLEFPVLTGDNKEMLKQCIETEDTLVKAIFEQFEDENNNYGLPFYMCGFDGKRQQEEENRIFEIYGILI